MESLVLFKFLISKTMQLTFNTNLCDGKPLIAKEFSLDFTAGGLNQLQIIYSANFLQCMNVLFYL
jgi:hypothetical protein